MPTASAASDAFSAPLGLPLQDLLFLQIPVHPSSNPSITHAKPTIEFLSARLDYGLAFGAANRLKRLRLMSIFSLDVADEIEYIDGFDIPNRQCLDSGHDQMARLNRCHRQSK